VYSGAIMDQNRIRVYRNADIKRVVAYIPPGHRHTRILIETIDGDIIVFQEATIAGIVRAYVNVSLHPQRQAVELVSRVMLPREKKPGFARDQLIESGRSEKEIFEELKNIIFYEEKS